MKQKNEILEKSKQKLENFVEILLEWQKKINLISSSTIKDIWNRHILDSLQLYPLLPEEASSFLDVGTGGGFPGMVLAIADSCCFHQFNKMILVESQLKKCVFLQEVSNKLKVPVTIINERIEKVTEKADVITSRAVMSCADLLEQTKGCRKKETVCLFLKGENVEKELQEIPDNYIIKKLNSQTMDGSFIIEVKESR